MKTYRGDIGDKVPENKFLPNELILNQTHYFEDYKLRERLRLDFEETNVDCKAEHYTQITYKRK